MFEKIFLIHKISVILFLLIYLVKTFLLLFSSGDKLRKISKTIRVPEMIISFSFLVTGIYMLTQIPEISKWMIIKITAVVISIPLAVIGFKKSNRILAVISLLLIIGAYGLAEMSKKKSVEKNVEAVKNAGNDGKALYEANCTKCHGEDGKAAVMGAYDLSATQLDDVAMSEVIMNGKQAMAGFKEVLTEEQVKAVVMYVHSLKK